MHYSLKRGEGRGEDPVFFPTRGAAEDSVHYYSSSSSLLLSSLELSDVNVYEPYTRALLSLATTISSLKRERGAEEGGRTVALSVAIDIVNQQPLIVN